jgi:Zn-dependent membrane protease YugP
MHLLVLFLLLLALILGPQLWVRRVLQRHNRDDDSLAGTGGELARHLLDRYGLDKVKVESSELGDHYDPEAKAVRLTPDKLSGRTLTAITTAAHEVGHALQDFSGYAPFRWRSRLVGMAQGAEKLGSFLLFAVPVLTAVTKAPGAGLLMLLAAVCTLGMGIVVQLATLPVEWDASFGKALPILRSGYIDEQKYPAARRILRACALTYVAASLAGLLNFWRWMRLLRR